MTVQDWISRYEECVMCGFVKEPPLAVGARFTERSFEASEDSDQG